MTQQHELINHSTVAQKSIQWLWPGKIPLGKITTLDGDPGLGKSLITLDLAARVSCGAPMPDGAMSDIGGPRGVVLLGAEDDLADTVCPREAASGADLTRIATLAKVYMRNRTWRGPHLGDLATIQAAITTLNAVLVVVDPIMAHIPREINTYKDQDVRQLLAPLAALAAETGAAILVVRHLNKSLNTDHPIYRGGGSIGIIGAARSGLLVAADPGDPEVRVLAVTKSSLARMAVSLKYRIHEAAPGVPAIQWLGESTQTAAALLAATAKGCETKTELAEAAEWLATSLKNGPVPTTQLRREAEAAGHTWATIRRAQRTLEVIAEKTSFQGQWTWRLRNGEVIDVSGEVIDV
jgi:hypothetical protein